MTKRILAMVLVLVLTLSMLPLSLVSAEAATEEVKASPKAGTHTDAGHSDDCGLTSGWQEWTDATTLPKEGQYVLKTNVNLTGEIEMTGDLTLCLNGYVIKAAANKRIIGTKRDADCTLTITDCTAYKEDGVYHAGALTGGVHTSNAGGGAIFVRRGGTLKVYDGRITGNTYKNDEATVAGGAVMLQSTSSSVNLPAKAIIYGGEFSDNHSYKANGTTANAGGVFALGTNAELTIEDGIFTGNSGGNGGVISVPPTSSTNTRRVAKITINGGTFTGNTATNGGVVEIANGATLTVTGGTFENNTASFAGVFYLRANTVKISGATIKGNTAKDGGSAIYVYSTVDLTIGDGTVITENTCKSTNATDGMGAAIVQSSSSATAKVTLTGKVYIAGNTIGAASVGDLCLRRAANDTLNVNELAEGSYVVFCAPQAAGTTDPDNAENPIIKVSGTQTGWSSGWVAFKDADGLRHIAYADGDFSFVTGHFHENVEYKPLTSADQLIAGGAYYLPGDVTLSKAVSLTGTTETSICLNGHKLSSTVTSEAAFSTKSNTDAAIFNIDDCTAYTDDEGVYHAGAIDGIENKSAGHGGIFMIRNSGTLNIYNGKITNNAANNVGGVAHVNGTVNVYGGYFAGNTAKLKGTTKSSGGVFYVNTQGKLYVENATFHNNAATSSGGAIYNNGKLTVKNAVFTENKAPNGSGGAIYLGGSLESLIEGSVFTGNSSSAASAIAVGASSVKITLRDIEVTGNTNTGSYGAVNFVGNVVEPKLEGKVIIKDNAGQFPTNLSMQKGTCVLNATGLTAGSEIMIGMIADRLSAGQTVFSTASASNKTTHFYSESDDYGIALNEDDQLELTKNVVPVTHKHTKCADTGCTEHTAEVTYEAWTDATKLPTEGNWYLDTDVTVSAEVQLKAHTLNLCLNGHTIKGFKADGARAYSTTANTAAEINISDCTAKTENGVYTAGKFTGFNNTHTNSGGSAIYIRAGSHLNFFDGIVEKCNASSGGAIYVHTATANIYNGLITDNTAKSGTTWKPGAGLFLFKSTVNVENARFTKNEAGYGAAIYPADGTCVLTLKDVTVTDNKVHGMGAVHGAYTAIKLTVSGNTVIDGNTDDNGAATNLRLASSGNIIVQDLGANAKIGVTVGGTRAFSNVVSSDLSAQFPNDDSAYVTYLNADSKLAQKPAFEHTHCVCGKADCTDASHEKIEYAAWTSTTSLPTGGSYCLTTDVTVSDEVMLKGTESLNLCLNGHTITGFTADGARAYSTDGKGSAVINVTDCTAKTVDGVYTAGKFTGFNNTHKDSGGAAIYIRAGGTLNFYEGIVENCTAGSGGGALYGHTSTINFHGGLLTNNQAKLGDTWKSGAGIFLFKATLNMTGGTITNNKAAYGAGIYLADGTSKLYISGGTITGNVATGDGAGVNAAYTAATISLTGDVTITGNTTEAGKASNLRLGSTGTMTVADLADTAKIGVTSSSRRAISTETQDYTAQITSDDTKMMVIYQDKVLYMASSSTHKHCLCAGTTVTGCDHATVEQFDEWDNPNALPTSGSYYLSVDVVINGQARLEKTTLNLCLNGHTIKVGDQGGRAYYMTNGSTMNITDCEGGGKFTGATLGAILTNGSGTDMEINLYNGTFTENYAFASGGALVIQGDCTFNMYGGKITGNTASGKLNLDADGNVKLDASGNQSYSSANGGGVYCSAGTTFNLYGGEISNNVVTRIQYLKAGATSPSTAGGYAGGVAVYGVMNIYGGKITANQAYLGGAIFVSSSGSRLNIMGGEITYNRAEYAGGGIISQTHAVTNLSSGCINYNTAGSGGGGGLYISTGTTLNMTGGEICHNVAKVGDTFKNGGGLYVLASTVNMSGGTVGYNKGAGGAGFYMTLSGTRYPTMNISGDALITGNEASMNGGAIFATGAGTKITMTGGEISKNKAKNGGGLITQTKSAFEFTGGKISGNQVTASGGGIYISTNTTFTMTGGSITGNVSKGAGGGACFLRSKSTLKGGSISYNTGSEGAGIKINGGNHTFSGVSIAGNNAIGTLSKTTGKYTGGNGGGINLGRAGYKVNGVQMYDAPIINIYSIYLANNKANSAAGGMLVQSDGTRFNMYGGTVCYNEAPNSSGGGIYFSTKSRPNVYGGSFYGNSAKNAAAIYFLNTTGVLENVKAYDNENSASSTIIATGAETLIEAKNIEVYDNVSLSAVGGIAVQGKATFNLDGAKIHNNTCKSSGGGVYFSTPGYGLWKNVEIYENEVTEGTAGGVFVGQSSWVTFENVTIRDNVASNGFGGGLFCRGRLDISNSKILNNEATTGVGGGLSTSTTSNVNMGQDAGIYATGCVISGNKAAEQGGGVYGHRGGPIYLHSCTITENVSGMEGGGVYANGRFGLVNSTVTGNTSGGEGFAVYFTASEFDGHSYSTGHKKIGGNMIIKDNEGGDMYLGEGSAVAVVEGPLGEKTHMEVTLHSGVISEHIFGEYNYEGGDLVYTITAGNRSLTDPEAYVYYQPPVEEAEGQKLVGSPDILLYAGIAIIALAVIAAAVLLVLKKKKAGNAADKATKE